MSPPTQVLAPGKLLLGGEYVVLWGGRAVVIAVAAHARARSAPRADRSASRADRSPGKPPQAPEVVLTRRMAEARLGPIDMPLHVDTSALYRNGRKLGLGSSAAAAAATAGWVHATHGSDLADPSVRGQVLQDALAGHAAVAPRGSGADVAASVLGGLIRFERLGPAPADVHARPLGWPEGLHIRLVWTGKPVRTSDLLERVEAARVSGGAPMRRAVEQLAEAAEAQLQAFERGAADAVLEASAAHHAALAALGQAAEVPLVEERLTELAALAAEHGGAAKPSGAGGGDVAVAFFRSTSQADAFEGAARDAGFEPLALLRDEEGLRLEEGT